MGTKFAIFVCFCCLSACSFLESIITGQPSSSPQPQSSREVRAVGSLDPLNIPEGCNLAKVYVFKVVCDPGNNIFGIDRSFVEAVCESELALLQKMPEEQAWEFLNKRLDFFNREWRKVKEASSSPYINLLRDVKITAFIDTNFRTSVGCVLNGGDDRIEVQVDVSPICRGSASTFKNSKCGVAVNNLKVTNNNYIISHIKLEHEGTMDPALAYNFTSGFIYQGFFPSKKNSRSGYYSEDPLENQFYMRKDDRGVLDRYK